MRGLDRLRADSCFSVDRVHRAKYTHAKPFGRGENNATSSNTVEFQGLFAVTFHLSEIGYEKGLYTKYFGN